jgi:hypothetical protein
VIDPNNYHTQILAAAQMNREMAECLQRMVGEAWNHSHENMAEAVKVRDDAIQLHFTLKLMRHWRNFERQHRADITPRFANLRLAGAQDAPE